MSSDTEPVLRLTQEAYDQLSLVTEEDPNLWSNPNTDFGAVLASRGMTAFTEETGAFSTRPISLAPVTGVPPSRADGQALDFYNSLEGMTVRVATDGLMWAWMTHFKLHKYSIARWPSRQNIKASNHAKNHWFVTDDSDALRKWNTASRTWWIAHMAITASDTSGGAFTDKEAIEHLATYPRHYHNMLDSNFSRHPLVYSELLRALMSEARGISGIGSDQIWKKLNLTSGTLLLDGLTREQIRLLIGKHVEDIMSNPGYVADRTRLRNRTPFRVLSLGAGVQSSCLALMAERGDYGLSKPDLAIFADTGWEPPAVYEHLDWLRSQLSYEVITVNSGNIRDNILEGKMADGSQFLGIPAFLINPDGSTGVLRRQCTTHYKTKPIHNHLRERLGIPARRRAPVGTQVEMWLGISTDEALRQKADREEWVTKRYPLIELGFNRGQLLDWFNRNYPDRYLPTSSCIGCPYHNDSVWKHLKENDPKSFQDAAFVDQALRNLPATRGSVRGEAFLHGSRKPLLEVDFSEVTSYDNLMIEECEGLCGI